MRLFNILAYGQRQQCMFISKRCFSKDTHKIDAENVITHVNSLRVGVNRAQVQPCNRFSRCQVPSATSRPFTDSAWFSKSVRNLKTSSRRQISTVAWVLFKPMTKFAAIIGGRGANRWYLRLSPDRKQEIWEYVWNNRFVIHGVWSAIVFGGFLYYMSHLESAPLTGRKRFVTFDTEQIRELAAFQTELLLNVFQKKMHPNDSPTVQRVVNVTHRLVNTNDDIKKLFTVVPGWTIHVIQDPMVNAFVLPSGHIFVFDGLLELLKTDDQLAIILGHEIAHAVLNHGVETLSLSDFEDFFVVPGFAYIWCIVSSIIRAMIASWLFFKVVDLFTIMPHSRRVEWEADFIGLVFAAHACYDIRQAGALWRKIADHQNETDTGLAFLPQWMLSHPDSRKRAEFFDSLKLKAEQWRKEKGCPQLPPEVLH